MPPKWQTADQCGELECRSMGLAPQEDSTPNGKLKNKQTNKLTQDKIRTTVFTWYTHAFLFLTALAPFLSSQTATFFYGFLRGLHIQGGTLYSHSSPSPRQMGFTCVPVFQRQKQGSRKSHSEPVNAKTLTEDDRLAVKRFPFCNNIP